MQKGFNMANQYTKKIDWEKVFEEYHPLIYTSKEIAAIIGVHPTTVRKAKIRLGIENKKLYKQFFKERNPDVYTLEELAFELNKHPSTIAKAFKRYTRKKRKQRVLSVNYAGVRNERQQRI